MKEQKNSKEAENTANKEAISLAKRIEEVMGNDFFTIDQMRKKMTTQNNQRHVKTMGGGEAKSFILSIIPYGLVETLTAVKDCYKIRLDNEYRIAYLKNQVDLRKDEINGLLNLIFEIDPVIPMDEKKVMFIKKTAKVSKKK